MLINNQLNNPPPTATYQDPQKTPILSQTNQSQLSTWTSFQVNLYTFEERHESEPLIPAIRHATLSEQQYKPTNNIYSSLQQDPIRTRHPSQNQNQTSTIDRQIIHPRRNLNFETTRVHFNITSSPSSTPLDISNTTIQSTPRHY